MLILSENGYAISSKTALTLKRSVKGGVAEPNDHHKVMILSFFGNTTYRSTKNHTPSQQRSCYKSDVGQSASSETDQSQIDSLSKTDGKMTPFEHFFMVSFEMF